MRRIEQALLLVVTVLAAAGEGLAQRTRVLGNYALGNGAPPVTALRRVAWSSANRLYVWNGSLHTFPVTDWIGTRITISGNGVLFNQTGANQGLYFGGVPGSPTLVTPVSTPNQAGDLYGDGVLSAWTKNGQISLYPGPTPPLGSGLPSLAYPHVMMPYVTWHTSTTATTSRVHRYDLRLPPSQSTWVADASQHAFTDEAGRVIYLFGGLKGGTRGVFLSPGPFAGGTRLTQPLETGAQYDHKIHQGQALYLRRTSGPGGPPVDVVLDDVRAPRRVLEQTGGAGVWLRHGMAAWHDGSLRLRFHDGLATSTLSTGLALGYFSQSGEWIDRGWVVYVTPSANNGDVVLRESPLTWEQDSVSASGGGNVQFNLIAGPANAGRPYVLLASLSGTSPGIPVGSLTFPLNYDAIVFASLVGANLAPLENTLGTLDGNGNATAYFRPPPGLLAGLNGYYLSFAYALYQPALNYVSNPARVKIAP